MRFRLYHIEYLFLDKKEIWACQCCYYTHETVSNQNVESIKTCGVITYSVAGDYPSVKHIYLQYEVKFPQYLGELKFRYQGFLERVNLVILYTIIICLSFSYLAVLNMFWAIGNCASRIKLLFWTATIYMNIARSLYRLRMPPVSSYIWEANHSRMSTGKKHQFLFISFNLFLYLWNWVRRREWTALCTEWSFLG